MAGNRNNSAGSDFSFQSNSLIGGSTQSHTKKFGDGFGHGIDNQMTSFTVSQNYSKGAEPRNFSGTRNSEPEFSFGVNVLGINGSYSHSIGQDGVSIEEFSFGVGISVTATYTTNVLTSEMTSNYE